jgi:hypothetical protein
LKQKKVSRFDWIKFKDLEKAFYRNISDNNGEYPLESGNPERNFLAHAGLAKNVIEVKFENEKLFIRYDIDNGEVNIWAASTKGLKPLEEKRK